MVAVKIRVLLHTLEYVFCLFVLFCLRVPRPPLKPLTRPQRELWYERLRALVPFVPVADPLSFPRRCVLHLRGMLLVVLDTSSMHRRKAANDDEDFSPEIVEQLENYPAYYRKNYHHQTDGYFSYQSARRYDMQYELVFLGVGQRARRVAASQLRRFLPADRPYQMLECGSGTGSLGAVMQALYADSDILITDPSLPYLRFATEKYPHLRVREVSTFMEDLSFVESSTLDVVFSAFVFHEIPPAQTRQALAEVFRVLKSGGYMLVLDSGQHHDGPENVFALEQFVATYHEPYYPEYLAGSLEDESRKVGFEVAHHQMVLFSKVLIARKTP
jgi:ubiquinone/menaquinone biosynthesis C-methylase UbiE